MSTAAGNGQQDLSGNRVSYASMGGSRGGLKTKTLRRMLKKAGLKTSGKKATLRARCTKAKLMRGGAPGFGGIQNGVDAAPVAGAPPLTVGGRHRRRSLIRKFF